MGFTYDISSTDSDTLNIAKVRLEAGDSKAEPWGMRPDGLNYQDEEILYFYEQEGQHIGRAATRVVETAANEWATVAQNMRIGEHWEAGQQAAMLRRRARDMLAQHGNTPGSSQGMGVVQYKQGPASS